MRLLIGLVILALLAWVITEIVHRVFSQDAKEARAVKKMDREDLTRLRKRTNLAERALREIAAGAELPVFIAEDALRSIEKTYDSKEIS